MLKAFRHRFRGTMVVHSTAKQDYGYLEDNETGFF